MPITIFKVRISYDYMKDDQLSVFSGNVVTQLTGNANFTFEAGVLENLTALSTDYTQKLEAAQAGGKVNIAEKRNARTALLLALRTVAQLVNLQGNNDEAILKSSGFVMANQSAEPKAVPDPKGFVAKPGPDPLSLHMQVTKFSEVDTYVFCYGPAETAGDLSNLQQRAVSDPSVVIHGLEPNVRYVCRVFYIANKKHSGFSSLQYSYVLPA